ncbi:VWA domain-containing protein [Streptomyces sp. NPDC017254]|uniref:VWA domain-containing protein n=1 Tax=unclassified Streptomyces TaxID=2593676 RepID=UPI0037A8FDE7
MKTADAAVDTADVDVPEAPAAVEVETPEGGADESAVAPEDVTAEEEPEAAAPAAETTEPQAAETPVAEEPTSADAETPVEADAEATATAEPEAEVEAVTAEPEADEPAAVADVAPAEEEPTAAPAAEESAEATVEADADADVTVEADAEATATAVPEAAVEAVTAEPEADEPAAEATVEPEAGVGPALSLPRVKALAPHLADAYKAAGAQLKKQELTGARAAVYLVVDRSGSMRGYFKDGSVQRLAEQVTALAAHLDEDATVTTVFFSTDIDGTVDLTPAGLTPTRVEEVNAGLGRLGRTNYHRAVEEVLAHHEKADPARPALVVFQTDGAPESKTAAAQALAEAEGRPLHWRFVAWGEEDNKAFDFVRKLDGTPRTATFFAGVTPVETAHAAFYRGLLAGLEF